MKFLFLVYLGYAFKQQRNLYKKYLLIFIVIAKFQVTSPFYLSLNEGQSEVSIFKGDTYGMYLPLFHIPTKPCAAYCGLSEVLKFKGEEFNRDVLYLPIL